MKIAEVAERYDITPDTLRYYERIGLLPHVPRTKAGVREYGEAECEQIQFVKCMRAAGVSIEALLEYLPLLAGGDATLEARRAILVRQRELTRARMADMQAGLDRLDYKIEHYDELIAKAKL